MKKISIALQSILCLCVLMTMSGCGAFSFQPLSEAPFSSIAKPESVIMTESGSLVETTAPVTQSPNVPDGYPIEMVPIMVGYEDADVLPGMNYTFCTYSVKEKLDSVSAFYLDAASNEKGLIDSSSDELFSISYEKGDNGVTITGEADSNRQEYTLVSITISPNEK